MREIGTNGYNFFQLKLKINVFQPLTKYMFIHVDDNFQVHGLLLYERLINICYNC